MTAAKANVSLLVLAFGLAPTALAGDVYEISDPPGNDMLSVCADWDTPTGAPSFALPVTGVITGNGGSWYQLYQTAANLGGNLYASWSLQTNNLNNGADDWVFGIETVNANGDIANRVSIQEHAVCKLIHTVGTRTFDFKVDAGAWGTTNDWGCTIQEFWKETHGVRFALLDGGYNYELEVGQSHSCSNGGTFDSESLLRGGGSAGPVCFDCVQLYYDGMELIQETIPEP